MQSVQSEWPHVSVTGLRKSVKHTGQSSPSAVGDSAAAAEEEEEEEEEEDDEDEEEEEDDDELELGKADIFSSSPRRGLNFLASPSALSAPRASRPNLN